MYTASAYAQHEIKLWNCLTGIAGVRYDYHELAGGRFTPKVAVMYSVGAFNIRGTTPPVTVPLVWTNFIII